MTKTEWYASVREVQAYNEGLRKEGHLITVEALQSVQMATTVRVRNGKLSTTDGPFAETKEQLGGFFQANPAGILPLSDRTATRNEIAYARLADKTPHIVLSKSLDKVAWKTTRIVRDAEEIRRLKQQPGKDMHAVGGATLVSSLMNLGLIDEYRILVTPVFLGSGTPMFKSNKDRISPEALENNDYGVRDRGALLPESLKEKKAGSWNPLVD